MIQRSRIWLLLLLLVPLAAACAPRPVPPPEVARIPYRILLHFSSVIPDPYYVLSGPFQTYQRFPVNDSLQRRLEAFVIAKSDPNAPQALELKVHATQLLTTFDRLGNLPELSPPPRVVVAGLGGRDPMPLSVLDTRDHDRFDDLPEQITKTAQLQLQVSVALPNLPPYQEAIIGDAIHVLERWDMGLRTYDYDQLISEVQTAAILEVDRVLHRALQQANPAKP